jgi:hypothetical protein
VNFPCPPTTSRWWAREGWARASQATSSCRARASRCLTAPILTGVLQDCGRARRLLLRAPLPDPCCAGQAKGLRNHARGYEEPGAARAPSAGRQGWLCIASRPSVVRAVVVEVRRAASAAPSLLLMHATDGTAQDAALERITLVQNHEQCVQASVVVEAIFENLDAKRVLFAGL